MLAPEYAALLRKMRRRGIGGLVIVSAMAGLVSWAMFWATSGWGRLVGGFTLLVLGFVAVAWVLPFVRARTEPTYVILDRRVRLFGTATEWAVADAERRAVTLGWGDLDTAAHSLGVEPLTRFLDVQVAPGIPRHRPERGLETIIALLGTDSIRNDEALAGGLWRIRRQLEAAQAHGAKFCLTPVSGWSGHCETVGLFLGTSDAMAASAE